MNSSITTSHPEFIRLQERDQQKADWGLWGSYLSDRQWGTVREDYSANGDHWHSFSYEEAPHRTYRWGEDGILGICDRECYCCFAPTFWNGRDPILKERLFGLTGPQGNHGEDLKEYFYHLDNTPTHSFMRGLYKYPQEAFPYQQLLQKNRELSRFDPEYELIDTGIFDQHRYFDIFVEYAKATPTDLLIQIRAINRSLQKAPLYILPTLWFRNTWTWGEHEAIHPQLRQEANYIIIDHPVLSDYYFFAEGTPTYLFTENETNDLKIFGPTPGAPLEKEENARFKGAFHDYLIEGDKDAISPHQHGTKVAPLYYQEVDSGEEWSLKLRLLHLPKKEYLEQHLQPHHQATSSKASLEISSEPSAREQPNYQQLSQEPPNQEQLFGPGFSELLQKREAECQSYYASLSPNLTPEEQTIQQRALSGLLWCKKFYYYTVIDWLRGDPTMPPPPEARWQGPNAFWKELHARDIISMPDSWEFPFFCSWDLMFQTIPFSLIDPKTAQDQNMILKGDRYTAPSAQQPGYEGNFSESNPPIDAWSVWKIYSLHKELSGKRDLPFLRKAFNRLLLSYAWWCNRVDGSGDDLFTGGFLGLDNISVFDRRYQLSNGSRIMQADGTSWMALFSINMLQIALELQDDAITESVADKFLTDFVYLTANMNHLGSGNFSLWNEEDHFYYDVIKRADGSSEHLKIRSMVGLSPLFVTTVFEGETIEKMNPLLHHFDWFRRHRPELMEQLRHIEGSHQGRKIISLVPPDRLKQILAYLFDENEFLSPFGIRSLSRYYQKHPYSFQEGEQHATISYDPGESSTDMFGGNSNWRGPVWIPMNYLIIESLQKFAAYYGNSLQVEFPTGSGHKMNLWEISSELANRLFKLFTLNEKGERPCFGSHPLFQHDPHWKHQLLFNEYYHAETGMGLGASHQTGWTSLIALMLHKMGVHRGRNR